MSNKLQATPVGQIVNMMIKAKSKTMDKYYIRLRFNEDEATSQDLKALLNGINSALVIDNSVSQHVPEGSFDVKVKSNFQVPVIDMDGTLLNKSEEGIPFFNFQTDSGTAQALFSVYDGGKKPTINLKKVKLHSLDVQPQLDTNRLTDLIAEHDKLFNEAR